VQVRSCSGTDGATVLPPASDLLASGGIHDEVLELLERR
jgi:hypothetical protein